MQPEAVTSNIIDGGVCSEQSAFIQLYKGRNCIFCEAAKEILYETLDLFGLTRDVVREIDIDDSGEYSTSDVVVLPSIKICTEVFVGLPDKHNIGTAIARACVMGCYS